MQHYLLVAVALTLGLSACSSPTPEPSSTREAPAIPKTEAAPADADAAPPAGDAKIAAAEEPKAAGGHDEGCIHGKTAQEGCEGHAPAPAAGAGHFGAPFTATEARTLAAAVKGAEATPSEASTLVSGEVTAVCQAKGCWMVLRDAADATVQARVIMKNHAFAVPFDGKGKTARVEGVLSSRTFTPAQVQHLAKDAGQDPAKVEAKPRTEWVLTATGVELAAG